MSSWRCDWWNVRGSNASNEKKNKWKLIISKRVEFFGFFFVSIYSFRPIRRDQRVASHLTFQMSAKYMRMNERSPRHALVLANGHFYIPFMPMYFCESTQAFNAPNSMYITAINCLLNFAEEIVRAFVIYTCSDCVCTMRALALVCRSQIATCNRIEPF